jgi:hypothetical protein
MIGKILFLCSCFGKSLSENGINDAVLLLSLVNEALTRFILRSKMDGAWRRCVPIEK